MDLFIYIVVELVLVIVSTIKYVVTVKSSPTVAALVATAAATIGGVGTKLLTNQPMYIIVIVLISTNLIGVPIGKFLVDKFAKDRLWVFDVTLKVPEDVVKGLKWELKEHNIQSMYMEIVPDKMYSMKIYSNSKLDSSFIKANLNRISYCKYSTLEAR